MPYLGRCGPSHLTGFIQAGRWSQNQWDATPRTDQVEVKEAPYGIRFPHDLVGVARIDPVDARDFLDDTVHPVDPAVMGGPHPVDRPHIRSEIVEVAIGETAESPCVFHIVREEIGPDDPAAAIETLERAVGSDQSSLGASGVGDGDLVGDLVDRKGVEKVVGVAGAQGNHSQESGHQS
ncbi:MAG: hypothetical protein KJN92_11270 [Gemmatimonadetes bacterium]|nr:hypothetical protein [Gemmatimonadota bacterium]